MNEALQTPIFMMNIPTTFSTDVRNNVWMEEYSNEEIIVNTPKAIREMWEVYSFIANQGFVYLLPNPTNSKLQDLTYVANNGIVLHNLKRPTFVGSNFKAENRIGEEILGLNFFEQLGYDTIKCPKIFEGEAEMKFIRDNIYIGGYGVRTEKEAFAWFKENFGLEIIELELKDPYMYHLDCAIFPLTKEKVIVATEAFSKKELKQLEKYVEIIPITIDQAHTGLTNSVRVNNYILNASDIDFLKKNSTDYKSERDKNNRLEEIVSANAMEVCYFNLEEFLKGGGLLSCLVLNVNYHSYKNDLL
jgi:N-dimethylarginine dimethylaminohydrolase